MHGIIICYNDQLDRTYDNERNNAKTTQTKEHTLVTRKFFVDLLRRIGRCAM